jgi:hypothetical protein
MASRRRSGAVLGHRCDNPLCQRVGEGHVVASSSHGEPARVGDQARAKPVRRWVTRAGRVSARGNCAIWRARTRRLVAADLARLRALYGEQLALW